MPDTWTAKDQRQYEPMRQTALDPQSRERRAVHDERSEDARTMNRRTLGTGNPRAPLEERSKDELYNLAEEHGIKGRSRMNKTQLITAIRRRQGSDL